MTPLKQLELNDRTPATVYRVDDENDADNQRLGYNKQHIQHRHRWNYRRDVFG